MLSADGYQAVEAVTFEDHHAYTEADISRLVQEARAVEANGFVTTEKDAVKLTPIMRDRLETIGPIVVARLCVELLDEKQSLEQLVTMVGRLDRRKRQ
jgi:tetraacyldisaccharide 4'-kinase